MSGPIRVIVVDDSAVARRLLTDALSAESDIEVTATAPTGEIGLAKIRALKPDLVVLDVEMPGMDGLQVLRAVRDLDRHLPVVLFTASNRRGVATTVAALLHGANAFVVKPRTRGRDESVSAVRAELVPQVRALAAKGPPRRATPQPVRAPKETGAPPHLVAIGSSAGGPRALAELLGALPAHFHTPMVIAQHMSAGFTGALARSLSAHGGTTVREAVDGAPLEPGAAWLAPGDVHLRVVGRGGDLRLQLDRGPKVQFCRPSVDVLFESVAIALGAKALAVVLSGMGRDGQVGAAAIREAGGAVLVQDPTSSTVWGMPRAVYDAGLADAMLPPTELAAEMVRRAAATGRA